MRWQTKGRENTEKREKFNSAYLFGCRYAGFVLFLWHGA